jgi:hypothetical protein
MQYPRPEQNLNSRLYVDITTAFQEQGRIAHGTTRVECGVVAGLAAMNVPNLQFCRYERASGRFVGVPREEAMRVAMTDGAPEARRDPAPTWRLHPLLQAGKRIEKWARQNIRAPLRAGTRQRHIETTPQPRQDDSLFASGATLFIPGELQRHDFAMLMALKRRLALRLAFVFYDLLGVLPAGDPRLRDPLASDLPSSDFIMREAGVVLSISSYSRSALLEHIASRGFDAPPIEVIRLGHFVRSAAADVAAPDGLRPGTFVLAVGDVVPRKNHALLLNAWRALMARPGTDVRPLVIAGRVGTDGAAFARDIAADPAIAQKIRIFSNADDRMLGWLYANCLFTVFPSLVEGYGLPVSESLAAGKVCVASSATAVPEAGQGLGVHLDPNDLHAWVAQIGRLMTDPAELRRQEQHITGFRAVAWSDTAAEILTSLGIPHAT